MTPAEVQKGARVVISVAGKQAGIGLRYPYRIGRIRSERENGKGCVWVVWRNTKEAHCYHLSFLDVVAPPPDEEIKK